jgi:hypothetical protein
MGQVPDHPVDALAVQLPLGFGVLALATLGLGELGVLNRIGLSILLVCALAIGLVGDLRRPLLERIGNSPYGRWRRGVALAYQAIAVESPALAPDRLLRGASWIERVPALSLGCCLVLLLLGTSVSAQVPVTDGDALCYHLQVPKEFLRLGAVAFLPDLHETVYPLVTEMLYLIAQAFGGPVACRWIEWILGLLFAASTVALARPVLGRRAWWSGVIVLLVPAVSGGMCAPLNDVALAAFASAALVAWIRLHDRPSLAAAIVAGLVCGVALGVKYPALVLCGLLAAGIAVRVVERPSISTVRRRWLGLAAVYLAVAVLTGGSWYLRAYLHMGNPVYPFFRELFGGAGLDEVLADIKRPLAPTFWNLLTALGPLTLQPDRFDSFGHQFGPVFLLFMPALLLERAPRRVLVLAALAYGFFMICLTQRQSMRFLLLALGPFSVGVAYLASAWWDRRTVPARVLVVFLSLALTAEASVALLRARHGLGVAIGRESVGAYLARSEPTYQVGRWVGRNLPGTARLIGQDHRGFYIPRDYTMELAHRRRTGLGRRGESAREIVARLRDSGFTHLLLCPPRPETPVEFDPTLGRLLASWLAKQAPLFRQDIADSDGVIRRYAIYEITPERLSSRHGEELPR